MTADGPPIPEDARRIGVVCPTWVGDTVMATPVLRAIAEHRPSTDVITFVRPALASLLAGLSTAGEIVAWDPAGLLGPVRAGRVLARTQLDVVLLLPNSTRSALAARWSRTPRRIGRGQEGRGHLLTDVFTEPTSKAPVTTLASYVALAEWALGASVPSPRLELATTDEDEAAADRLLEGVATPFLLVNPGANRADKRWPAASFAAAARAIAARHGLTIVVTGAPREAELVREVVTHVAADAVDLVARGITLGALKAVVRRARLLVSNDTGPRHLSLAFGTPLVSLFGPTDHRWTNLGADRERILVAEPFLPEELLADRCGRLCRIDRITPGDVVAAADTLLA